jgi:hypothetical protein
VVGRAKCSSAFLSAIGNSLPRFSARRRMPAAALADSQYLRSTGCVSKTSDNEDTTATLGDSEEPCIDTTPRDTVPEFIQVHEYPEEIDSFIDTK